MNQWIKNKQSETWKQPHDDVLTYNLRTFLVAWNQETQVWSLGQEDPLEKGMETHSSILAWWIPWTEEPGGLQSMGSQRVGHHWTTNTSTFFLGKIKGHAVILFIQTIMKAMTEKKMWFILRPEENINIREVSLACYSPWGPKELDITEWVNWRE